VRLAADDARGGQRGRRLLASAAPAGRVAHVHPEHGGQDRPERSDRGGQRIHAAIVAILLALSITACTRTVTRTHYVRVPCLPSEAPPIPTADFDTAEWEAEYVALLGAVAYVWRACRVEEAGRDESATIGVYGD
jgi:hypothetical protein